MRDLRSLAFIRCIKESDTSSIFRATFQGRPCLMKVYHAIEKQPSHPTYREIDPFFCESTAYVRLKERGLCEQGIVPDFYGDKLRPNAVLLEFIPSLMEIDLAKYTEDRAATLLDILHKIHDARIYHGDPYPRNIVLQPETGKVLWIDFDRAQTFPEGPITERQNSWMKINTLMTAELLDLLVRNMG
ncbi:hypothetical protein BDQ94DRAFT_162759 [Aspergillus welwitschiae]|uniref:Protein kinase domain-containing protein n=1 Tax=Aspergillus welwitschiae TaxID=1341132 RepID=A0A3F3PPB2_9EURO|nr:hypothetical protein BDQ94DRAFT_162759 [Aspergillus welwitschiae]RDH28602.1 hypothetical protein BDQ94DRAFT_162759 [Aspergillus welwitschiae]